MQGSSDQHLKEDQGAPLKIIEDTRNPRHHGGYIGTSPDKSGAYEEPTPSFHRITLMIPRTEHRRLGWLLEALQKILEGTGERTLQRTKMASYNG